MAAQMTYFPRTPAVKITKRFKTGISGKTAKSTMKGILDWTVL